MEAVESTLGSVVPLNVVRSLDGVELAGEEAGLVPGIVEELSVDEILLEYGGVVVVVQVEADVLVNGTELPGTELTVELLVL